MVQTLFPLRHFLKFDYHDIFPQDRFYYLGFFRSNDRASAADLHSALGTLLINIKLQANDISITE